MALWCLTDANKLNKKVAEEAMWLCEYLPIQSVYCDEIAKEKQSGIPFFEDPNVKQYLESVDLTYQGNYLMRSDNWGSLLGGAKQDMPVTFLHYSVQLGCVLMKNMDVPAVIVMTEWRHIRYVLKKRDVYMILKRDWNKYIMENAIQEGIPVYLDYVNIENIFPPDKLKDPLFFYADDLYSYVLRREKYKGCTEWEALEEEETEEQSAKEITLSEYVQSLVPSDEGPKSFQIQEDMKHIRLQVKGKVRNASKGTYVVHYLVFDNTEWRYAYGMKQVESKSTAKLFVDSILCSGIYDYQKQCDVELPLYATKRWILVRDEQSPNREDVVWDEGWILYVAKYDGNMNRIEICDIEQGIAEFREILQNARDL